MPMILQRHRFPAINGCIKARYCGACLGSRTSTYLPQLRLMGSGAIGFENAVEQRTPVDLEVHGTIPTWLTGVLYRTGPGTTRIPTRADPNKSCDIHHWFDGLTMHHRFEIFPGGQRVTYCSRKGAEDLENRISREGKYPLISFGQKADPCQSLFRKIFTVFTTLSSESAKNASPSSRNVGVTLAPDMPGWKVAVADLPKRESGPQFIVAKTDASGLQLIDPCTLEPLKLGIYKDIDPRLDGQLSAAHSCRDRETGAFYNYSCKIGGRYPTYKIFEVAKDGATTILATVNDAPASYMHSFAMTENYVILCVWQAHLKHYGLSILYNMNMAQSIDQRWDPKKETLMYVIDRKKGGIVAKYKTPPFFCFHQLNAFEDPQTSDIVMDMSVYQDNSIINVLYLDYLRSLSSERPSLLGCARRFRLKNVRSGEPPTKARDAHVEFTLPPSETIELPTVRPELYHRPYRYAYGISNSNPTTHHVLADSVIKVDMARPDGEHKKWRMVGHVPGEPIFVSHPGGQEEDDGVLLCIVLDQDRMNSSLVVLDAREMKEVARAEMKQVFPFGFHGVWTT